MVPELTEPTTALSRDPRLELGQPYAIEVSLGEVATAQSPPHDAEPHRSCGLVPQAAVEVHIRGAAPEPRWVL